MVCSHLLTFLLTLLYFNQPVRAERSFYIDYANDRFVKDGHTYQVRYFDRRVSGVKISQTTGMWNSDTDRLSIEQSVFICSTENVSQGRKTMLNMLQKCLRLLIEFSNIVSIKSLLLYNKQICSYLTFYLRSSWIFSIPDVLFRKSRLCFTIKNHSFKNYCIAWNKRTYSVTDYRLSYALWLKTVIENVRVTIF